MRWDESRNRNEYNNNNKTKLKLGTFKVLKYLKFILNNINTTTIVIVKGAIKRVSYFFFFSSSKNLKLKKWNIKSWNDY